MKALLLLAVVTALAAGCGGDKRAELPTGGTVTWERALQLVADCDVVGGFQPHQGPVSLQLRNGSEIQVDQPHIDAIFFELDAASARCGRIPFATE